MSDDEAFSRSGYLAVMRRIAGTACVITTTHEGRIHGMTATAVASVSADPPTVLIVVNRGSRSHPLIDASGSFVVNILAGNQKEVAARFGAAVDDQFKDVEYALGADGCPVLAGAAAYLECRVVERKDVSTHSIFIGRVHFGDWTERDPLLYHNGVYARILSETPA